jgi:hypothetical protein
VLYGRPRDAAANARGNDGRVPVATKGEFNETRIEIQKEDSMRQVSIGVQMFAVTVVAIAVVAGCATSTPVRTEKSTSGIRAAEEVGAPKVPQAALHLQLAKEELENAKSMAAKDEREMAASMLTRAEADAELAVLLSREQTEKSEALAAVERVRQLRQDNKLPALEKNNP